MVSLDSIEPVDSIESAELRRRGRRADNRARTDGGFFSPPRVLVVDDDEPAREERPLVYW